MSRSTKNSSKIYLTTNMSLNLYSPLSKKSLNLKLILSNLDTSPLLR